MMVLWVLGLLVGGWVVLLILKLAVDFVRMTFEFINMRSGYQRRGSRHPADPLPPASGYSPDVGCLPVLVGVGLLGAAVLVVLVAKDGNAIGEFLNGR